MNCHEAHQALKSGAIDAEVEAHLAECEACRELADGELAKRLPRAADGVMPDFDALMSEVESESGLRASFRALSTPKRFVVSSLGAIAVAVVFFFAWLRPDFATYPAVRMWVTLGALVVATKVGIWMALRPAHKAPLSRRVMAGIGAAVMIATLIPGLLPMVPDGTEPARSMLVASAICLSIGLAAAIPGLGALWLVAREDRWNFHSALFAALGLGLAGHLALQVHCPIDDPIHILTGHSGVAAIALLAVFIADRLRVRTAKASSF